MARVRTDIVDKVAVADIEKSVAAARRQIELGQKRLKQKDSSPWFTFSVAAGIFLREGFEAVLILVTLLGVVRTMGSRRALAAIHLGWGVALGLGLVFWASSGWLMSVSGAQRETLEGVIGAIAVLVLLYLGFWLHRKTEIGKWHDFIKTMVNEAMENRKVMALGLVSFTAVFREVFETVLFLRALTLEAGPSQQWAMLAGVVASFIVVILLALAMLRFSAKLPLRQLFGISSAVMIFLAVVLTGKAMHAFQETGLVTMTNTPFEFRLDLLGIYPTFETLVPQFLLVVLCLVVWLLPRRMLLSSPTENSV